MGLPGFVRPFIATLLLGGFVVTAIHPLATPKTKTSASDTSKDYLGIWARHGSMFPGRDNFPFTSSTSLVIKKNGSAIYTNYTSPHLDGYKSVIRHLYWKLKSKELLLRLPRYSSSFMSAHLSADRTTLIVLRSGRYQLPEKLYRVQGMPTISEVRLVSKAGR